MKTEKMFEVGESAYIKIKIAKREFDERGNVKYKVKDEKTGKIFDWNYTNKDIVPFKKPSVKIENTEVEDERK